MAGKARAALRAGGLVALGMNHSDAMTRLDSFSPDEVESGWVDESGEFHLDMESALQAAEHRGCVLVRHAESRGNAGMCDDQDPGLSPAGYESLPGLARFMSCIANGGRPGLVSPMLRCLETARAIQDAAPTIHFRVVPRLSDAPEEYMIEDRRSVFSQFDWPETPGPWHGNQSCYLDDELRGILDEMSHGAVVVTHASWVGHFVYELGRCRHELYGIDDIPNASVSLLAIGKGCSCRFSRVSDSGALIA